MGYVYDHNWDGKEVWALIKPNGEHADFYESTKERAEDYVIAEALTGGANSREQALKDAQEAGYKIERIK